ncbi:MAG: hypothetical protein A2176_11200 [Spirochaetes bacterium RBG_13_51_14]|nr:MAG: hypothetical protein A2176_11200 [Spirochaetes bacterium RBG_13_51_14]
MNLNDKKPVIITSIFFLVISFLYCAQNDKGYAKSGESSRLNETALLFAGKDIPKESTLYPFTEADFYKSYRRQMESGWNQMQKPNMAKITKWWQQYKPSRYSDHVFYPFSGPDIMNAITFFPDAEIYILFGLEPPGIIPDPHSMTAGQIIQGLNGLRGSLGDILHMNFFKTEGMAAEMGSRSFNSITGVIIFFLAMNGYTLVDAQPIAIDAQSNVVPGKASDDIIKWQNPPKSRVPGVEITFRKDSGKIKKVRYYMLNVIDYALDTHSPNFIPYIKKEGPYATIIKSASYLMHNDNDKFTKIRAAILAQTNYLVQDDSGIPLRYFTPDRWKLTFHGYYDRPIGLFANRMQQDLKKVMDAKSTGKLPFSYGYDYKPGQSNLITAEKIK